MLDGGREPHQLVLRTPLVGNVVHRADRPPQRALGIERQIGLRVHPAQCVADDQPVFDVEAPGAQCRMPRVAHQLAVLRVQPALDRRVLQRLVADPVDAARLRRPAQQVGRPVVGPAPGVRDGLRMLELLLTGLSSRVRCATSFCSPLR